jgi:hypothetical protein
VDDELARAMIRARLEAAAGRLFRCGHELVGPTQIAVKQGRSQSTISYHLDVLASDHQPIACSPFLWLRINCERVPVKRVSQLFY